MAERSFWFQVGYSLEEARLRTEARRRRELSGPVRPGAVSAVRRVSRSAQVPSARSAAQVLGGALIERLRVGRTPSATRLTLAAAAGAASALGVELLYALQASSDSEPRDPVARIVDGAGLGVMYSLAYPVLPFPHAARGVAFGVASFLLERQGLAELADMLIPRSGAPLLRLLPTTAGHTRTPLEHALFGALVGFLYRPPRTSTGMDDVL